jgi:DNA-binding HxlR family transcriptional regulator
LHQPQRVGGLPFCADLVATYLAHELPGGHQPLARGGHVKECAAVGHGVGVVHRQLKTNVTVPLFALGERQYYCPVQLTVETIAVRWKPMIVWHLVLHEKMRYGEIRQSLRTVTHKMLTQSLRELEADGLVTRTVHEVVPPTVEYAPSDQGQRLRSLSMAMNEFGDGYRVG